MRHDPDKRIDLPVPFLQEGSAIVFGHDVPEDDRYRFLNEGIRILSLPDLAASLTPDLRRYLFPGSIEQPSAEDMSRCVRDLTGLEDSSGILYRQNGALYFHVLPDTPGESIGAGIEGFLQSLRDERETEREERKPEKERKRGKRSKPSIFEMLFSDEAEETLDSRTQAILEAWGRIEREFGITIEDMQVLLGYKVKLSRLHVTTSCKLYLTDFDNREVKMNDLSKALYFFFLRHPEGARLKKLHEHEDEILRIYSGLTGRDDPEKIRESVRNLLDPYGNELNVGMSRIKRAFKDVVSDRVARFYYVDGLYGEVRTVALDRDLVIWEH